MTKSSAASLIAVGRSVRRSVTIYIAMISLRTTVSEVGAAFVA